MKTLMKVGFVLAGLLLAIFLIGFLLPRNVHVERSAVIEADPLVVFEVLMSPRKFAEEWSPWFRMDTLAKQEFFGPSHGVGSGFTWSSENGEVGAGKYTIESVENLKRINVQLDLGDMGSPMAAYTLEAVDGGTKVTWMLDSDMGGWPQGRYFGLFLESILGPVYEQGLENLGEYMDALPKGRVDNIELSSTPNFEILSIREEIDPNIIGDALAKNYVTIMQHINGNGLEISSPPFAIYHYWPLDGVGNADVEAAIPISTADAGEGSVRGSTFKGGEIVTSPSVIS